MTYGQNGEIDVYASLPGGCPPTWQGNEDGFGVYSKINYLYIGFTDLETPHQNSQIEQAPVSQAVRKHSH